MPVPTWRTGDGPGRITAQRPAELRASNGRLTLRLIPEAGGFTQRIELGDSGVLLLEAGRRDILLYMGGEPFALFYDRALLIDAGKANARLRATIERPEFEINTVFELHDDGSLDVMTSLAPRTGVALSSMEQRYDFAPALAAGAGAPWDYLWLPHLKDRRSHLIGQPAYRSPCLIIQRGPLMAALIPYLSWIEADMPLPAALDFHPPGELRCGLAAQSIAGHVFFQRESGRLTPLAPGQALRFGFKVLGGDDVPERMGMRPAARALWKAYGQSQKRPLHTQTLYWDDLARYAYDNIFERYRAWRELTIDGRPAGGVSVRVTRRRLTAGGAALPVSYAAHVAVQRLLSPALLPAAKLLLLVDGLRQKSRMAFFSVWHNNLRTAYGLAHFGRRWGDARLAEAASRMKNLLLAAPTAAGLSPVGFVGAPRWPAWLKGLRASFLSADYGTADLAETGVWMLEYYRDIEPDAELLGRARALGEAFLTVQAPDGYVPAWLSVQPEGTVVPAGLSRAGATTAAAGRFLARLAQVSGEARFADAACRAADFIIEKIWPAQEWSDFETSFSCASKPSNWRDAETRLPPQGTLAISWAADLLAGVYRQAGDERYLAYGLGALDLLLLFQQVWDAPFLGVKTFGGFGATNTDIQWNDARQALFVPLLLDYYGLTGEREYFERAIAALRAAFALMLVPEHARLAPANVAGMTELDYGALAENYGHGGRDRRAGAPFYPDWGAGSACTAAAWVQRRYGDLYVDVGRRRAFGINGCHVREQRYTERTIDLHIERLPRLREPLHRTALARLTAERMWIKCGNLGGRRLSLWINSNDLGAFSPQELEAGVSYHPSEVPFQ